MAISTAQKKKGRGGEEEFDSEFWMVTFGDLLSLMLTFFVLLFSMGSIDDQTLDEMLEEFRGGVGLLTSGKEAPVKPPILSHLMRVRSAAIKEMLILEKDKALKSGREFDVWQAKGAMDAMLTGGGSIKPRGPSFVMSMPIENLFDKGSAELKPKMKPALKQFAKVFRFSSTQLWIEGHTDDIEIASRRFPSNWELSSTRAANVMRFFYENTSIAKKRLLAFGYADTKPLVRNLSEKYRVRNRRVDIVIRQEPEV